MWFEDVFCINPVFMYTAYSFDHEKGVRRTLVAIGD